MRIVLADDHEMFRQGVRLLLESHDRNVVGECSNAEDLRDLSLKLRPDVVILDYRMPGDSLSTLEYIKARMPECKVIMLTGVQSALLYQQITATRIDGLLKKEGSANQLIEAIDTVIAGDRFFSAEIRPLIAAAAPELSKREFQIFNLIVQGLTGVEIADQLNLAAKTVDGHRQNIMKKLNTKNVVELVNYAHENDLFQS